MSPQTSYQSVSDAENELILPHIGAMLARIREVRGIIPDQVRVQGGFPHASTVTRLEAGQKQAKNKFATYIEALQELAPSYLPITAEQKQFLYSLYNAQQTNIKRKNEEYIAALDFQNTLPEERSIDLDNFVRNFEAIDYPAIIMDDLWFDHAINGSLCNLFNIKRKRLNGRIVLPDLFYTRWEAWHSIGLKFPRNSPIRKAYEMSDRAFLSTVLTSLMEDSRTYPHLFSSRMRVLLKRLYRSAIVEGYDYFATCWHQVTSLQTLTSKQSLIRYMEYEGKQVPFKLKIGPRQSIRLKDGNRTNYAIASWLPTNEEDEKILKKIADNTIYYAAHHDRNGDFHVNTWVDEIEQTENEDAQRREQKYKKREQS